MRPVRLLLAGLLFGLLIACDDATRGRDTTPQTLLKNVQVTPSHIKAGETATLLWETVNENITIFISPLGVERAGSGGLEVTPSFTTEYTLTASSPSGASQDVNVTLTVEEEYIPAATIGGTVYTPTGAAYEWRWGKDAFDTSTVLPNDPLLGDSGTITPGVANSWLLPPTGNKITIAYLGYGIRTKHEDIGPALLQGYDFCADLGCTTTDDDVDTADYTNTNIVIRAHGTYDVGLLVAESDNGLGGVGYPGTHTNVLEVLPLKVAHTEPLIWGDGEEMGEKTNGTPGAYLSALKYALGLDPDIPDLTPTQPADILYLGALLKNDDTWHDLTPEQEAEFRNLFQRARELDVLILAPSKVLADEILQQPWEGTEWLPNPLGIIANDYQDIVLTVESEHEPDYPGDVQALAQMTGPEDVGQHTIYGPDGRLVFDDYIWGGYSPTFRPSAIIAGTAALIQHHRPELRGAALRDALVTSKCDNEHCEGLPDPYLSAALGLPGAGDPVTLTVTNSAGEIVFSEPAPMPLDEIMDFELDFDKGDTYTLEARAVGAEYTLTGSATITIENGYMTQRFVMDTLTPNE